MRRFRIRRGPGAIPNQPRSHRQTIVRAIYLACVLGLAGWLGNLFFGSLVYLRSDGMMLGEPAVVAAEFPVTVRNLLVREGQRVDAGEVMAVVSSQSVAESVARLTAEVAAQEAHLGELRIRGQRVEALSGIAQDRQQIASAARSQLEELLAQGYLSIDKRTAAVESDFRGRQDLEVLRAEKRVVDTEIETMAAVLANAEAAIDDLRNLYDRGRMRAPIDGIIGRVAAERGAVVRLGEPIVEVYGDQRFVLAYLPTGRLYDIAVGAPVVVRAGLRTLSGVVSQVEPIAAALPREFQRAFYPVQRQQVIRVEFVPDEEPLPLFTKVRLNAANPLPRWIDWVWTRLRAAAGPA